MTSAALGRLYHDREIVFRQGDVGDCLYVVQEGQVEVLDETDGRETLLRLAGKDELFGEMAVFERERRSATVRARGTVRILTIDKKNFLRQINEDPSLAFNLVQRMSQRVRDLSAELVRLRQELTTSRRASS
jgi:CRP/FNR family cyclic AMP-dependent transcriptional regulator